MADPAPGTTALLSGVRNEAWRERVDRRFKHIATTKPLDERFSDEQNRQLMITDAQFQADKEMLNEIHLMLRFLTAKALQE